MKNQGCLYLIVFIAVVLLGGFAVFSSCKPVVSEQQIGSRQAFLEKIQKEAMRGDLILFKGKFLFVEVDHGIMVREAIGRSVRSAEGMGMDDTNAKIIHYTPNASFAEYAHRFHLQ